VTTASDIRLTVIAILTAAIAIGILGTFIHTGMTHLHPVAG